MPEATVVTVKVADMEPVRKVLAAAGELATWVDWALGSKELPPTVADVLRDELAAFRATVKAQANA